MTEENSILLGRVKQVKSPAKPGCCSGRFVAWGSGTPLGSTQVWRCSCGQLWYDSRAFFSIKLRWWHPLAIFLTRKVRHV